MQPAHPPLGGDESRSGRHGSVSGVSTSILQDTVLELVRRLRFAGGRPSCPRCGSATHRWGMFSGRQRYRCVGCRRTFSDLTGTVFRHLKRLDVCPAVLSCMSRQATIRSTAQAAGISKDTAFRWRHRLLAQRAAGCCLGPAPEALYGFPRHFQHSLALVEFSIIESLKGQNPWPTGVVHRAPRHRVIPPGRRPWARKAWLVSAAGRARTGGRLKCGMWFVSSGEFRPGVIPLERLLQGITAPSTRIGVAAGRHGAWAVAAKRCSRSVRSLGSWQANGFGGVGMIADRDHAGILSRAFRAWLQPFRGVSTGRLPSYLGWHLVLTENPGGFVTGPRLRAGLRASGGTAGHRLRSQLGETFAPRAPLKGTRLLERLLETAPQIPNAPP
jgi:transposase-like protein